MATLYNKYNAPCKHQFDDKGNLVKKLFASCPGDPIYAYKYKDKKTGEMKENTVNMQEKIQSYLTQVDYKKRIELGLRS